jgi:hypothetical protein
MSPWFPLYPFRITLSSKNYQLAICGLQNPPSTVERASRPFIWAESPVKLEDGCLFTPNLLQFL